MRRLCAAGRPTAKDVVLETENLKLLLHTPEDVIASLESMSSADRAEVSPEWLARVKASKTADPWLHGFAIVHRTRGTAIGSCGFKSPPGREADVEIAYGVDPPYRGRGYATEAARALIAFAFNSGRVRHIRAHTLPEENASTRVLTKCGFEFVGAVNHPEDGLVWRWELQLDAV